MDAESISMGFINGGYPFKLKGSIKGFKIKDTMKGDSFVIKQADMVVGLFKPKEVMITLQNEVFYQLSDNAGTVFLTFPSLSGMLHISDSKTNKISKIDIRGTGIIYNAFLPDFLEMSDIVGDNENDYNAEAVIGNFHLKVTGNLLDAKAGLNYDVRVKNVKYTDGFHKSEAQSLGFAVNKSLQKVDVAFSLNGYEITTQNSQLYAVNNRKLDHLSSDISLELNKPIGSLSEMVEKPDMFLEGLSVMLDLKKFNMKFEELDVNVDANYKAVEGDFENSTATFGIMFKGLQAQLDKMLEDGGLSRQIYSFLKNYSQAMQKYSDSEEHLSLKFKIQDGEAYIGDRLISELQLY